MGDYTADTFVNNTEPPINDARLNALSRGVASAHEELNRMPVKRAVRAATVSNITSLSGIIAVDGSTVAHGDRILVKNQTTPSQNGIYVVNDSGPWARAGDNNTGQKFEPQFTVYVRSGYYNYRTEWMFTGISMVELGVTNIAFTRRPLQAPIMFTINTLGTINTTATAQTIPTGMPVPGNLTGSIYELGLYSAAASSNGQSGQSRARWAWNLLEYGQFKIITNVLVAGSANAVIRPQYLKDDGTWANLLDNGTFGNLAIASVGTKEGAWNYVYNAAMDVRVDQTRFMRLVVEGNTNTSTTNTMTQLGNTYIIFRG